MYWKRFKKYFVAIGSIIGIIAATIVSFREADPINILWVLGNPFILAHVFDKKDWWQVLMFSVYTILAIIGVARIVWGLL